MNATLDLDRVCLNVAGGHHVAYELALRLKHPLVKVCSNS